MRRAATGATPEKKAADPIVGGETEGKGLPYITITAGDSSVSCRTTEGGGRKSVTCRTCRGTGRIPRGQEELVALIPYSDQRLRPQRTKLYVFLAVLACLLVCFLVIFFLFPRSVVISHAGVNSSAVSYDTSKLAVSLLTMNKLNITNNNWFGIEVTALHIEVLHLSVVVGGLDTAEVTKVGPLVSEQVFYSVQSTIQDNSTFDVCTWPRITVHNILLHIQGTLTCTYLGHWEQLTFDGYEYLDCRSNSTVPHSALGNPL